MELDRPRPETHHRAVHAPAHVPRRLALFPGAFRPPHQAHLAAIRDLAARDDIDEVVVIVSGRARHVPGTLWVLPPLVAQAIFDVYLRGLPKVRVEIAERTAVARAHEYIARAAPGDRVLLCLGESDFDAGDSRFDRPEGATASGVRAEIVAAHTGHLPVRATDLRRALALGEPGREAFRALLPPTLDAADRTAVWEICLEGLRPIDEWAADRLRAMVVANGIGALTRVAAIRSGTLDPVFRLTLSDGRLLVGKFAGDTVDDEAFDDPKRPKPRRRLQVESRTLTAIASAARRDEREGKEDRLGQKERGVHRGRVVVPDVVMFDKQSSILLMTDVGSDGRLLEAALGEGEFDTAIASALGEWLAWVHTRVPFARPVWGNAAADRAYWQRVLERSTSLSRSLDLSVTVRERLDEVLHESAAAGSDGLRLLGCDARSVYIRPDTIALVDFERAGSHADPAFDLGRMMASYAYAAVAVAAADHDRRIASAEGAIAHLVDGYVGVGSVRDPVFVTRARGLAAAILAARVGSAAPDVDPGLSERVRTSVERMVA